MYKCPSCNRSTDEAKFSPKVYPNTLCRDCDNKRAQEYRRSYDGMTKTMYSGMVKNSKDRRMALPNFTGGELCAWLEANNAKELHAKYVKNGLNKKDKPSIDRISDYLPYCFSNMQLLTWEENNNKAYKDRVDGRNTKQSKSVIVIDENGSHIKVAYSINAIARELGCRASHISDVLHGRRKHVYKYTFKYEEVA